MKDIEFYFINIINILNDVRIDERDCNEGSLTDEEFLKIISNLIKIYELKKPYWLFSKNLILF